MFFHLHANTQIIIESSLWKNNIHHIIQLIKIPYQHPNTQIIIKLSQKENYNLFIKNLIF